MFYALRKTSLSLALDTQFSLLPGNHVANHFIPIEGIDSDEVRYIRETTTTTCNLTQFFSPTFFSFFADFIDMSDDGDDHAGVGAVGRADKKVLIDLVSVDREGPDHICCFRTLANAQKEVTVRNDWLLPLHVVRSLGELEHQSDSLVFFRAALSPEHQQAQQKVWSFGDPQEIFLEKFNLPMRRMDFATLQPLSWLNDQIINFFMEMLVTRSNALVSFGSRARRSYFFNSFFVDRLRCPGYTGIHRWTKNFDIFALEEIYFPINISNRHWVLVVANMIRKTLEYFDSMPGTGESYLEPILTWIVDEAQLRKGTVIQRSSWTLDARKQCPQQTNTVDCGVFVIACADYTSDHLPLSYKQRDMPILRQKIAADISRGYLLYPLV